MICKFQKQYEVLINYIEKLSTLADNDNSPHKRGSYIKKQKLAVVDLVLNEKITKEDSSKHRVSKYSIAKK